MRLLILILPLLWVVYAISQEPALNAAPTAGAAETVPAPPAAPEIPTDIPANVPPAQPEESTDAANHIFSPSNDAFIYDPTGKRDPFDPNLGGPTEAAPAPTIEEPEMPTETIVRRDRPLDPLEAYDLAQIKVEAVIWDTKSPRAMLRDPQGGVHYVKIKSRIGKKDGFVVAIREGEVVVVEYAPDSNGQFIKTFKALELR